jgi:hypothetical protein
MIVFVVGCVSLTNVTTNGAVDIRIGILFYRVLATYGIVAIRIANCELRLLYFTFDFFEEKVRRNDTFLRLVLILSHALADYYFLVSIRTVLVGRSVMWILGVV